jgi:hypothetical protein
MKQQVETVASLQECVGECTKNVRDKGGQGKSLCCISWPDKTQAVSHEQMRQGSVLCLTIMLTRSIQKQDHMDKPRGQKICKKQHHIEKRYAHVGKKMQGTRMRGTT